MNVNLTLTKDYRKYDDFVVRINKPNLVRRRRIPKMNVNAFLQKDYENETAFRPKKTNPIQTQFTKGQNELKIACRKIRPHPSRLGLPGNCCNLNEILILSDFKCAEEFQ